MEKDAMGQSTRHRGYADGNLSMAMTTQSKGPEKNPKCKTITQKYSYAIPLKTIYLTPLNRWTPIDLEYKKTCTGRRYFKAVVT